MDLTVLFLVPCCLLLTQAAPSPLEQDFGSVPTFQILSCIATENNSSYFSILTHLPLFTFPWPTQARLGIGQVSSLHIFSLSLLKNSEFFKLRFQTRAYHVFQIPLCDLGEKHHLVFVLGELDVVPLCMSGSLWHCEEEHPKVSKAFICPIWFIIWKKNLESASLAAVGLWNSFEVGTLVCIHKESE